MTLAKRLCVGVCSLVAAATFAASAAAEPAKALSDADARAYSAAFVAVNQGDFVGAELQAAEIQDKSLAGYLAFRALMHPTAHTASFEELCGWLNRFRDLALADRVFTLAAKRKPAYAPGPPVPEVVSLGSARSEITRPAREAFYSGDVRTAQQLAVNVGERWIAGLSAWRLKDYRQAQDYFAQLAKDDGEDPWLRSAGAFWAARSAAALGDPNGAHAFLKLAAQTPQTFYGMIAERQVRMISADNSKAQIVLASYQPPAPEPDLSAFVRQDPRAHRAAALAQIGYVEEARMELRAGLALARTSAERQAWTSLLSALGPYGGPGLQKPQYLTTGDYQMPPLEPRDGFTIDRALVYAIVRQESGFNPGAVSPVGALGLMQVMPASATLATGDRTYVKRPRILLNPSVNLRVGQDYLTYLIERGVGPDLLRTVAAYNAGPGAVLKTASLVGEDDTLLLIECLPALETRNYVEKVMAAYWTYKRMFGEETRSLDALAGGAKRVDAHLDLPDPARTQPQYSAQPLQIGAVSTVEASTLD
jgi:soluble lytic murein transglycosylase-like protein